MTKKEFKTYLQKHKPVNVWNNDLFASLAKADGDYQLSSIFYLTNKIYPNTLSIDDFDSLAFCETLVKEFNISKEHFIRADYYTPDKSLDEPHSRAIILSDEIQILIRATSYSAVVFYSPLIDPKILSFLKEEVKKYPIKEVQSCNLCLITEEKGNLKGHLIKAPEQKDIDISKSYNDDFTAIDSLIKERLNEEKGSKGLILLHGDPGTGKTSYIRHLMNEIKKKFVVVSSEYAHYLDTKEFTTFLLGYQNSILIIEDAENAIRARGESRLSAAATLLNLSDGLLSDVLNIQVVITFNTELSKIDQALLRKGRLIARYDFKPLAIEKAQALSDSLGYKSKISQPTTLANIYNQEDLDFTNVPKNKIGFGFKGKEEAN